MSDRYRVREIAQQAGLSEATVDRVLHNRANVRESTRREVEQAIRDLDKQRSQLQLAGRKYLVDVVMQAPQRFSKISAVLHHDLRADANIAGRLIIQAHGGMSGVDMSMSTSSSR